MQNTVNTLVVNSAAAVVKNDTGTYVPSINLGNLGVPVKVTVAQPEIKSATDKLIAMEAARRGWETNELAASNARLYSILTDAYRYYLTLKEDANKDVRKESAEALKKFIDERGYVFTPSTHDMTRVVKCVFGVDRRRVSAYSIALREALRQGVGVDDLVDFLEQSGGVEQVRLGGKKSPSVTKRAEKVKSEVIETDLGFIKLDAGAIGANTDWNDKQVVIVATYQPTGEFQVNAVVRHDSAVNAALAACYSKQEESKRKADKAVRDAAREAEAAEKSQAAQSDASVAQEVQPAQSVSEPVAA